MRWVGNDKNKAPRDTWWRRARSRAALRRDLPNVAQYIKCKRRDTSISVKRRAFDGSCGLPETAKPSLTPGVIKKRSVDRLSTARLFSSNASADGAVVSFTISRANNDWSVASDTPGYLPNRASRSHIRGRNYHGRKRNRERTGGAHDPREVAALQSTVRRG